MNDLTVTEHIGLMRELEQVTDSGSQLELLQDLGTRLCYLGELREDIEIAEAEIYYNISRLWNNAHIKDVVKEHWDNDFYKWASEYSLKGRQKVAKETVDNKARVFKLWLSPEATITPPPTVYLEKENEEFEELEFDTRKVPYSKLLTATGAANRGDMSEASWAAMIDPNSTVKTLKKELYKARRAVSNDASEEDETISGMESVVFNGGGILYYQQDGMTVPFAQLLYENTDNPLFAYAANRLLQMYGLEVDNELDVEIPESNRTELRAIKNGSDKIDKVQLYHRGRGFAELTLQEATEMMEQLIEMLKEDE